jgi:imidazolonepropionase
MKVAADLIVRGASEALTFRDDGPGLVREAALAAHEGVLVWVGETHALSTFVEALPGALEVDAAGQVLLPGLVDCHSHFVYGGDRAAEFALRCEGLSYLEIAAAGGGIQATVDATTQLSSPDLVKLGLHRARQLLEQGITTSEAKSGYGLSVEGELRLLGVIGEIRRAAQLEIHPTLLGLHALPRGKDRERFLDEVVGELIPRVAEKGLAGQFDAFLETGAFSRGEVERASRAAQKAGLSVRLHADQLSQSNGAELAAELGAVSADHLEQVSHAGVLALARAGTSAVLAPVATLAAQAERFAPFRELREAGVSLALCTNWNPGSAPTENVWLTVGLACLSYRIPPWEALRALTVGGARVLGQKARLGRLAPGFAADFGLYATSDHRHLASHWGVNHATRVFKRGQSLVQSARTCDRGLDPTPGPTSGATAGRSS